MDVFFYFVFVKYMEIQVLVFEYFDDLLYFEMECIPFLLVIFFIGLLRYDEIGCDFDIRSAFIIVEIRL